MSLSQDIVISQSANSEYGPRTINNLQSECLSHMEKNGIHLEEPICAEGKIHRFSIGSKKNKDGWYIAWDGISARGNPYLICIYGSWKTSGEFEYRSWLETSLLDEREKSELQKHLKEKREASEKAMKAEQDLVAKECQRIWKEAENVVPTEKHLEYLKNKKVKNYGLRFGNNKEGYPAIIIPLRNTFGEIRTLQYISVGQDGSVYKSFHAEGEKKGNFFVIGSITSGQLLYVSEGYATGASSHEAIGHPAIIAFDCNNLSPVVESLCAAYPDSKITILADDDRESHGNPGKTKATEAATRHKCNIIVPKFPDGYRLPFAKIPTDFNDLHVNFGIDELKKQLLQRKPHLNPIDISSFLALKIPPRRLLLDPWLPAQGLTMIYAQRGVGKTYVALSVAYAIACGSTLFNWRAPEPKRVLYIDGEMPAITMQERLGNIAQASDRLPPDPSYFKLVTPDILKVGIRDISTHEGQADINEYLNDFDLIVIDNLSTLVRSGRENESESWIPVQEWALELRRRGKSVLFVHHAGKGGQQRGTSKKEDVLDTVINLKHPKDYSPKDGARFEIHFEKARGFDGDAAKPFEAYLNSKDEKLKWSFKEVENRDFEIAIELYNDGMNVTDIAKEIGVNKSTISRWMTKAKNEGRVNK